MTGRTHDLASVTLLGVVLVMGNSEQLTISTLVVAVFANLIGGIAPDIDQPTAPFWRNLPIGSFFGKLFSKVSGGHRFITHSIAGVCLMGYLAKLALDFVLPLLGSVDPSVVWLAFMLGVVSHLFMDMFTKEGVPLLLPIPIKIGIPPLRALRLTTGERLENWLVFPGLIVLNIWFYVANDDRVIELLRSIR